MRSKILVVDDEPEAVELLEFNLKQAGFDVVTAADGAEALKKARSALPGLILLDLMLPEVQAPHLKNSVLQFNSLHTALSI